MSYKLGFQNLSDVSNKTLGLEKWHEIIILSKYLFTGTMRRFCLLKRERSKFLSSKKHTFSDQVNNNLINELLSAAPISDSKQSAVILRKLFSQLPIPYLLSVLRNLRKRIPYE